MTSLFDKFRKTATDDAFPAPDAAQEQAKPRRGLSIRTLMLPLLATGMAVLIVVAALTYFQFSLLGQERRDAVIHGHADRMADHLAGRLQAYTDIIAVAGRNPDLAAAMAAGDETALDAHGARLRSLFPAVLRIRFIALGDDRVDDTATPPLSYACLELARMAEAGQLPPVEAHLYGSKVQHIDMLRPVTGPQGVVGSLMVTLDVAVLRNWLGPRLPAEGGYAELRQVVDGQHLMLAAAGDAGLQATPATYAVAVAGTAWNLIYWAPASMPAVSAAQQTAFLTVFGVGLAVVLLAFALFTTVIGRTVRGDLVAAVKQAVEMWSGRRQHNFDVRLAESLEVLTALEQHLHTMQPKPVQPDTAKAAAMQQDSGIVVDEPPEGDDMPSSLLFMAQDAMQVEEQDASGPNDDKSDKS